MGLVRYLRASKIRNHVLARIPQKWIPVFAIRIRASLRAFSYG
jgi:hypothetical protein